MYVCVCVCHVVCHINGGATSKGKFRQKGAAPERRVGQSASSKRNLSVARRVALPGCHKLIKCELVAAAGRQADARVARSDFYMTHTHTHTHELNCFFDYRADLSV